ncbi:MAG: hypothetical protein HQ581_14935 [Planctomycetes bacterium]|nr:hypothetical protein [Planctomycetota bacterium]
MRRLRTMSRSQWRQAGRRLLAAVAVTALTLVAVGFLLGGICCGQALTIQVPPQNEPYTLIYAQAIGEAKNHNWRIQTPSGAWSTEVVRASESNDLIAFTGPPGPYTVFCFANPLDCNGALLAQAMVTIKGASPPPDPLPPPPPSNLVAVVIVEESSTRTPQRAAVLLSSSWRTYLRGQKIPFRLVDPDVLDQTDNAPSDLLPSLTAARATPGPDVCFVGADGSVLAVPLPDSVEAMMVLLKQYGGEP